MKHEHVNYDMQICIHIMNEMTSVQTDMFIKTTKKKSVKSNHFNCMFVYVVPEKVTFGG